MAERVSYGDHTGQLGEVQSRIEQELFTPDLAAWVSGLLEVSGTMTFSYNRRVNKTKPYIKISDNHPERLELLKNILGGYVNSKDKSHPNQKSWVLWGDGALQAARAIEPYAVLRRRHVDTFSQWEAADTDGKLTIAREHISTPDFDSISPDDYSRLIENPAFVAGVVESKGILTFLERYDDADNSWVWNRLDMTSKNRAILAALHRKYKGGFTTNHKAGDIVYIEGKEKIIKYNSEEWTLGQANLYLLLDEIVPHMRLRREEIPTR